MSTKRERRKWALQMSASLLRSDMDCFDLGETDDKSADEADEYRAEVRKIANELEQKAKRMK